MIFFDWLRRLFRGKNLGDIQKVWEQTEHDLTDFMDRTQAKRLELRKSIDALTALHREETAEKEKAAIFASNLKVLRTQSLNLTEDMQARMLANEEAVEA